MNYRNCHNQSFVGGNEMSLYSVVKQSSFIAKNMQIILVYQQFKFAAKVSKMLEQSFITIIIGQCTSNQRFFNHK